VSREEFEAMKDIPVKKAAAQPYAAAASAAVIVAVFALTWVLWPRLAPRLTPLFAAAALLLIWLDSARRRATTAVRRQALQLGAVAELGRRALSGVSAAELSNVAVSLVARRTGAESAALWEVLPGGCFMAVRASVGWADRFLEDAAVDLGTESMLSRALDSAEPVVVTPHTSDPRLAEPPHVRRGARGCVSVAVHGRAGPCGVLSVYTGERRGFTEGDVHFIQAVAVVLSSAAGRAQGAAERSRLHGSVERVRVAR
jgi:GAF domain-containing protein